MELDDVLLARFPGCASWADVVRRAKQDLKPRMIVVDEGPECRWGRRTHREAVMWMELVFWIERFGFTRPDAWNIGCGFQDRNLTTTVDFQGKEYVIGFRV